MSFSDDSSDWRTGSSRGRAQISLMHVFRDTGQQSRKPADPNDEREINRRAIERREGVGESTLRGHLQVDLGSLLNTVRLDTIVDLEGADYVKRSVLNYGFRDFSAVRQNDLARPELIESIRETLIRHEPRLNADSIIIEIENKDGDHRQHVTFRINAELHGDPVDVPLDFVAEVDIGAGRMKMSQLQVQS